MKTKKMICAVAALVVVLSALTGCFGDNFIDSGYEGQQKSKELLQYLSDNDAEGLKGMFCNTTKSSPDLDDQIQEAMEFFEGKIESHDSLVGISGGGQSIDDGKTTKLDICPHITNIKTDAGKTYEILFYSYLVRVDDENRVGISEIDITSSDGEKCVVGKYLE